MRLRIDDGYTLPFATEEAVTHSITGEVIADGLPVVKGRYRPALFKELQTYQFDLSRCETGEAQADRIAAFLIDHIVEWDVVDARGHPVREIRPEHVHQCPAPIITQLLDTVSKWAPREQEKTEGNSPEGSESPS